MEGEVNILVGMPRDLYDLYGGQYLQQLPQAHSKARVRFVYDRDQFKELIVDADGVIVQRTFTFPPEALQPDSRLRWIQNAVVGVNNFLTPDLKAADHITLTTTKGPQGPLMAEHIMMLMLALARNLPGFLTSQAKHEWSRSGYDIPVMRQLLDKTVVILGVGYVGAALARICKVGFGMRVLGMSRSSRDNPHVERYFQRGELHWALSEADFVCLCLPLIPQTEKMMDAAAFQAMKPSAYLINVARGRLVDQAALIKALQTGTIAGVGLDVAEVEPLPKDSPLWDMPNVIITPHLSPGTDRMGENIAKLWAENIRRFVEHEPMLGVVDREAGY